MRHSWALVAALVSTLAPAIARADKPDVPACLAAHEGAQLNRRDRALLDAASKLRVCTSDACPSMVRADCVTWLAEVQRDTPSVVLEARADEGVLVDVLVTMDQKPLASRLDGRQIELDPGVHRFRFEAPGKAPIEQLVVLRDGEKAHLVSASWETPKAPVVEQPVVRTERYTPSYVYVVGAVGIAAVAAGTVFFVSASGKRSDLESSCKPFCSTDDVSSLKARYLLGNVGVGVGVAALATAVVLFVLRPERPVPQAAPTERAATLRVTPTADGIAVSW